MHKQACGVRNGTEPAVAMSGHALTTSFTQEYFFKCKHTSYIYNYVCASSIPPQSGFGIRNNLIWLKPRNWKCNSVNNYWWNKAQCLTPPAVHWGFDIILEDVDMLLEKVTSILSHWNAETMESQAGKLSEGCRAVEPARNCTQYCQRSRMDTVPCLPNTLSALHPPSLNYLASSAPTKKS